MPQRAPEYWWHAIGSSSFLEYAFLRWVLAPAVSNDIIVCITAQREIEVGDRRYSIDYEIRGAEQVLAIELDGFEFHSSRKAFSYDRLRQNDLHATGCMVVRFSYDSIRSETERCVSQLQSLLALDPKLRRFLVPDPKIEKPDMNANPLTALEPSPISGHRPQTEKGTDTVTSYFDTTRQKLNLKTLRQCQSEAFAALGNYYGSGGKRPACVMSVGAGKTALGVLACLAFSQRRAMIVTPGNVVRGTFDQAFDHEAVRNVLYGLPAGPLIPGCPPPSVLTLDRDAGPIKAVTREQLVEADVILTNFHSLGTGDDPDDLLSKLAGDDTDYIVIDEAHIAAAESYQRTFRHFEKARTLLMSACFQRLDGKPIDADVVYRYRLIDSIADGNAKNPRVQRFAPNPKQTTYEIVWPDGAREEILGKDALLEMITDERKLARITAKSNEGCRRLAGSGPGKGKTSAIAGECGRQTVMGQRGVGKIAENRGCCCLLHGEGMMRSLPALGLQRMATGASLGANECGYVLREGGRHQR